MERGGAHAAHGKRTDGGKLILTAQLPLGSFFSILDGDWEKRGPKFGS